jgi:hypothetical protein
MNDSNNLRQPIDQCHNDISSRLRTLQTLANSIQMDGSTYARDKLIELVINDLKKDFEALSFVCSVKYGFK